MLPLICLGASGQDDFGERFYSFQRQSVGEFHSFNQECNRQYALFLKEARTRFSSEQPVPLPDYNEIPPVDWDTSIIVINNEIEVEPIEYEEVVFPEPIPINKPKALPIPAPGTDIFHFVFYGTELKVRMGDNSRFHLKNCDGDSLSEVWNRLTDSYLNITLQDLETIKSEYGLCDWAWLQLLRKFSESFYGKGNEASIVMAFLYCQSGYSMRIGVQDNQLVILFPSSGTIFGKPYYRISGQKFYSLNAGGGDIEISDFSFPNEKPISLSMSSVPRLASVLSEERTLSPNAEMSVRSKVNRNLLDFFNDYPDSQDGNHIVSRWAHYANTPVSASVSESLYPQLQPFLNSMSEYQAVSFLLGFVQDAFEYEYDDKVWGHDRAFFVEETLYYPYADCEDRAILFSRLVRDLVGLDVALVYYPGHLATAVNFSTNVQGDYILLKKRRFTICDPTYFGAPVGATMPNLDSASPKVFLLAK